MLPSQENGFEYLVLVTRSESTDQHTEIWPQTSQTQSSNKATTKVFPRRIPDVVKKSLCSVFQWHHSGVRKSKISWFQRLQHEDMLVLTYKYFNTVGAEEKNIVINHKTVTWRFQNIYASIIIMCAWRRSRKSIQRHHHMSRCITCVFSGGREPRIH